MRKAAMESMGPMARDEAEAPAARGRVTLGQIWQYALIPLAFLLLWYVLGQTRMLPAGIIPRPENVAREWWYWIVGNPAAKMMDAYSGTWAATIYYSLGRVAKGYMLGLAIGAPLGILIGWSSLIARIVDPSVQAIRPIPITAWIPFAIAWFGIEDANAIFLVTLSAFFPIVINSTHGARDINKNLVRAARMMGASDWQLLIRVILPNALPAVFTGMRLGIGYSWTVLVVAEMISVKAGVGYVLWDAYYISRMEIVVADMITVGMLGFLSDRVVVLVQSRVLHWKQFHSE